MKLLSNYLKEMKISTRGFYFYVEIVMAIILIIALNFLIPRDPTIATKEVLFYDMPEDLKAIQIEKLTENGKKVPELKSFKLKPDTITYFDDELQDTVTKTFTDSKEVSLETYELYDLNTGKMETILYFADSFDDMLRISRADLIYGAKIYQGKDKIDYQIVLMGDEPERVRNLSRVLHSDDEVLYNVAKEMGNQEIRYLDHVEQLDFRESIIPLAIVILNGLMGMMLVIAYISIDKEEGLIKAFSVTPTSTSTYYLSKILVVCTISLLSSIAVTIPVMGMQPNYPLLILSIISMTVLSCVIGLLTSTFFHDVQSAFGALILMVILLILPTATYQLPSFNPSWMKYIPSYYMLEAVKESLLKVQDIKFIILVNVGMLLSALLIFSISVKRHDRNLAD